jgi:ADP-ribosyl-[dinitrogen reductase] hydrolase
VADLSGALRTALEAVAVARQILLAECARAGGPRGEIDHCPADDEAEWAIRECLQTAFPAWGFLGEETPAQPPVDGETHVWVVDPNDGTSSMQRGYRGHAVSIGVVCEGRPVLGVVAAVDAPDDDGEVMAWAEGCGPPRHNGVPVEPLELRPRSLGPENVVCLSQGANRNPVGYRACVSPARFVSLPSIAYRLALVATGEYVATVSLNHLSAWDYAAGHALVRGAGGVLVDETGSEITYARNGSGMSRRVFGGAREIVNQLVQRPWERVGHSGFGDAVPPPGLAPVRAKVGALVHDSATLRRAQGCLLGQIAGDALGALVEFAPADRIRRAYPEGGPRRLAGGGPHSILAGQPTDDSELALMLARTLVATGRFDQEAVAAAYARWYHGWTHAEQPEACTHRWCKPFDVGNTTAQALGSIRLEDVQRGQAASRAMASASLSSQANGALMRISPLGIWGAFRKPLAVDAAARQDSRLTHPHAVCQDASAVVAVTLAAAIRDGLEPPQAYARALEWSRAACGADSGVGRALEAAESELPSDFMTHQGWVLVALQNAFFQLLHAPSLEAAVVATVRAGGDTDTNAAICGALVGAVYGRTAIPSQWRRMVLSCRPMPGQPDVEQPRPALFWPTDALILAERLLADSA